VAYVDSSVKPISWKTTSSTREESVRAILLAVFLVLAAAFSVREHDPPAAVPANAAPEVFSAGRAVRHLSVIADKPHPVGSVGHTVVHDYLTKQLSEAGLEPQTQTSMAVGTGTPVPVTNIQNVIARLKGTATGKALLLVAHYDSTLNSFGASDNGSAVASLLETLRALKAGPPLKNDVIFLFTDSEEHGQLGAKKFVAEHPWYDDVGVVLNFDARGSSGPVLMFETSENNGWLIEQFGEAAPYPMAHSLSYELYRLLPNVTDLTIFKRAGMPGLNFANIDGIDRYHSPQDNLQGINESSMQHRGSYALALTRQLANADLSQPRQRNAVYFDLFGSVLVRYSSIWILPLTFAITGLFATVMIFGFRRKKLTVRGIVLGFVSLLISLAVASLVGWLLWKVTWMLQPGPSPEAVQSRLLLLGFLALALAITSALFTFVRDRANVESLATGALLWWLLLMLGASVLLPGATFVLHWPLLFSLLGLGWLILAPARKRSDLLNSLILSLCALPGIILMAPLIYQIFVGLTLNWTVVIVALVVSLCGLLLPHLRLIAAPFKWILPGASAVAAVVLLIAGVLTNAAVADRPANQIFYTLNADTGKAFWASDLAQRDGRTAQFFTGAEEKGSLADFAYKRISKQYSLNAAPAAPLPAPEMSVIEDKTADGVRTLRLQITSPRQAGTVSVYIDSVADVLSASLNKTPMEELPDQWGVRIEGIAQHGVELELQLKTSEPLKLRLVDQSYGLPAVTAAASTPSPLVPEKPDMTLLVKTYSL
jgi:hypothetical protein